MKQIDVSGYLHPDKREPGVPENGTTNRPARDITYSALLGYGFRPTVKPHDEGCKTEPEQH
jgi:hypothetical protein